MKLIESIKNNLSVIGLVGACVLGGVIGGVAGWLTGSMTKPGVEISGEELNIDDNLYTKFLDFVDEHGGDVSKIDLTSTTSEFSIPDLVSVAYYKFCYVNENSTFYSYALATSKVGLITNNQTTACAWYKRGDKVMKENTSKASFVGFSDRTYNFDITDEDCDIYEDGYETYHCTSFEESSEFADSLKYLVDFESGEYTYRSKESYIEKYSLSPEYCCNYLIEDDTVEDITIEIASVLNEGTTYTYDTSITSIDGGYTISLVLNDKALESYKVFMPTTTEDSALAAMSKLPEFNDVGLKFTLDKNLNLIQARVSETYTVHAKLGDAATTAESIYTYDYDSSFDIPSLETMSDFTNTVGVLK